MRTDSDIKRDVEEEIRYDADVHSSDIGVSVKSGVVSLTGFVGSYSQKLQAEADAKRVSGVMGVANDIQVRLPAVDARPDPEIARDVVAQLKAELPFSYEQIKSNGMDAPALYGISCAKVEVASNHLIQQERPG